MVTKVRIIFAFIIFCISFQLQARDHQHHNETQPLVGIHGMAVFPVGDQFYASHMPLANSIHAHQVVFSLHLEDKAHELLTQLAAHNDLVSISPELFDLAELMNGELTAFSADVYAGHFERSGELKQQGVLFTVKKLLLSEPLGDGENGSFYQIPLTPDQSLLVHKISPNPSYDQILLATVGAKTSNDQTSSAIVEAANGDHQSAANGDFGEEGFSEVSQLYLELQDFR